VDHPDSLAEASILGRTSGEIVYHPLETLFQLSDGTQVSTRGVFPGIYEKYKDNGGCLISEPNHGTDIHLPMMSQAYPEMFCL